MMWHGASGPWLAVLRQHHLYSSDISKSGAIFSTKREDRSVFVDIDEARLIVSVQLFHGAKIYPERKDFCAIES
jgi:hypothetical protein